MSGCLIRASATTGARRRIIFIRVGDGRFILPVFGRLSAGSATGIGADAAGNVFHCAVFARGALAVSETLIENSRNVSRGAQNNYGDDKILYHFEPFFFIDAV